MEGYGNGCASGGRTEAAFPKASERYQEQSKSLASGDDPEIKRELVRLANNTERLYGQIEILRQRLQPVLSPSRESDPSTGACRPISTELGAVIYKNADAIATFSDSIQDILVRLAL